jgi:hypothetical protein
VTLIATSVDLDHRTPCAPKVLRRGDGLGKRCELAEVRWAGELVELHRPGEVAADEDGIVALRVLVHVDDERRATADQVLEESTHWRNPTGVKMPEPIARLASGAG